MKRFICISLLIGYFLTPVFAEREKVVHVNGVQGEYAITTDMDISPKAAYQKAIEDALRKAVEKVSKKTMKAWDMTESGAEGESFTSVNMIQVDGEILDYEEKKRWSEKNPAREKEIVFYCIIDAVVKDGIEPDPDFGVTIKGVRGSYQAEEELTFSIISSRDAYLKVFIFENEELGYRLYPNDKEQAFKMNANQEYQYPTNKRAFYELYTDKEIETDRLVFVLTKTECPFMEETTSRRQIEQWIANIKNDQKFVTYKSINILKR